MKRLQRPLILRLIDALFYDEPQHHAKEAANVRKHLKDSKLPRVAERKPKEPEP